MNNTLYGDLYNLLVEKKIIPAMVDEFPNFEALEVIKAYFVKLVEEGKLKSYYK